MNPDVQADLHRNPKFKNPVLEAGIALFAGSTIAGIGNQAFRTVYNTTITDGRPSAAGHVVNWVLPAAVGVIAAGKAWIDTNRDNQLFERTQATAIGATQEGAALAQQNAAMQMENQYLYNTAAQLAQQNTALQHYAAQTSATTAPAQQQWTERYPQQQPQQLVRPEGQNNITKAQQIIRDKEGRADLSRAEMMAQESAQASPTETQI